MIAKWFFAPAACLVSAVLSEGDRVTHTERAERGEFRSATAPSSDDHLVMAGSASSSSSSLGAWRWVGALVVSPVATELQLCAGDGAEEGGGSRAGVRFALLCFPACDSVVST